MEAELFVEKLNEELQETATQEVADKLRVSSQTVRLWQRGKNLPAFELRALFIRIIRGWENA